ncbi:TonB family protein [Pelagicoccus albus]|uniref:TonB family protein n=1 Tax=Pelagicoccus albus TaxID=415222 RepID=A0A7X1B3Y9_9BACT|nr:TonB family protein [Pelagicoccus albus]MBC2605206.1 TonB family protein [Pelagicoccus albus]
MYGKSPLCFLLLITASLLSAEPLEIYYFANQQAYRLDGFDRETPQLTEVSAEVVSDFEGHRHEAWWVKGELPLKSEYAATLSNYTTKRIANSYKERYRSKRYKVFMRLDEAFESLAEPEDPYSLLRIVGWIKDGEFTRFTCSAMDLAELEITESEFGGFPVCYYVQDGELVRRKTVYRWDRYLLGEETNDRSANLKEKNNEGRGSLHFAAANGNVDLARQILEENKKFVKSSDRYQGSALFFAAANGREEVVELLLSYEAPIADGNQGRRSILSEASRNGHLPVVKLMAPGKPKGSEMKWHYSWAASDALNENYDDVAMYLIENGANFTVKETEYDQYVLAKFAAGYPELGFKLIDKFKLEPNVSRNGYNLLHSVASYADVSLLERVHSMGVDLKEKSRAGMFPVDHAIGLGNVESICWFLDNGGRYEIEGKHVDPFKYAISNDQISSVECLIGYGYDVNREILPRMTPLMFACYFRRFEIAKALADAGGVYLLDSPHAELTAIRLIEGDQADLVARLIEQGWEQDRLVLGELSLQACSEFFESDTVKEMLETRGWIQEEADLVTLASLDERPNVLKTFEADYPAKLQEKFGDLDIVVRLALSGKGTPVLVDMQLSEEQEELRELVEQGLYAMRLTPSTQGGESVCFTLKTKIQLKSDFDLSELFELSDVDMKPQALVMATPLYPFSMQSKKARGRVVVQFILGPNGKVYRAHAISSTHYEFEEPAILCVEESVWQPARKNGTPVACKIRIPIQFAP